jgi:hypothetical protein
MGALALNDSMHVLRQIQKHPEDERQNSGNLRYGVGVATMPFVCLMGGG